MSVIILCVSYNLLLTTSSQMEKMVSLYPRGAVAVKTKEHNREQELLTTPWHNITSIANLLHISL